MKNNKIIKDKWYWINRILIVLIIISFLFLVRAFIPDKNNILILDNVEVTYFNQTNTTLRAIWAEGQTLYTIGKNKDNQLIIGSGEECNEELMNSDGTCFKFWTNLNEGEMVLVIIQSKESLSEIFTYEEGDIIPESICYELPETLVVHKTGCPGCAIALPILEELQEEYNLSIKYVNVAEEEDRNYLLNYLKINTRYVPALIYDCEVYIGALTKEEYKEILGKG